MMISEALLRLKFVTRRSLLPAQLFIIAHALPYLFINASSAAELREKDQNYGIAYSASNSPFMKENASAQVKLSSDFNFEGYQRIEKEGLRTISTNIDDKVVVTINGTVQKPSRDLNEAKADQPGPVDPSSSQATTYLRTFSKITPLDSRELAQAIMGDNEETSTGSNTTPNNRVRNNATSARSRALPRATFPVPPAPTPSSSARNRSLDRSHFSMSAAEGAPDFSEEEMETLEKDIEALREQMNME